MILFCRQILYLPDIKNVANKGSLTVNSINPFPGNIKKIAILSPAGIPDPEKIQQAVDWFASHHIEAVCGKSVCQRGEEDYFAADREKRAADFNAALEDPQIDMILCARGGYGSASILPLIRWDLLRQRNMPVMGFSDITALHLAMLRHGAGIPVTGQMAAALMKWIQDPQTVESTRKVLARIFEQSREVQQISLTRVLPSGGTVPQIPQTFSGPLIPANLSILASLCGSDYLPDFQNAILVVEDVGELPRKLDRHLTQLELCGILDRVQALVFADFTQCGTAEEMDRIYRRFAEQHPGTVFWRGLSFGHELPSLCFQAGCSAVIDAGGIICF